jgi:hypothetical protein
MVLHDLAQETSYIFEAFVHTAGLGLPQRELYRYGTECIAGDVPYRISAFHDRSIGLAIICTNRGC